MDDVPSVRLLRGEPARPLLLQTIHPGTGRSRWQLLKADGLTDRDGCLIAAVTVIEDVTAVKSAEVRMRMLSEAGRVLVASPELRHAVENIAQIAVPELADWCVVDLIAPDLRREQSAVAHRDAGRRHDLQRLRELEPEEIDPGSTIGRAFTTGEPVLFGDVGDARLVHVSAGDEHLRILRDLRIRSATSISPPSSPIARPSRSRTRGCRRC